MRVERGIKRFKLGRRCVVFGPNSLEWILSLSKRDWSAIAWWPSQEIDDSERALTLAALALLGGDSLRPDEVGSASTKADVLLGSGPLLALSKALEELDSETSILLLISGACRSRGPVKSWSRRVIGHEAVGGVTDWVGTSLSNHWAIPSLPPSVRRNIGHVLEHGDRPTPCCETLNFPHLSVNSLLPLKELIFLDVAFHSYSSRTNWGRRQLNRKEIAGAMDLPLWFSTSSLFDDWYCRYLQGTSIPLKPFQTLMGLFLKSSESCSGPPSTPAPTCGDSVGGPAKEHELTLADDFWIESLEKMLPGSWVRAGVVSDKAAKADDARVHTSLWDQRIVLVLPSLTGDDLEYVRPCFYFVWCQKLTQCYQRFMLKTHGLGWQERLFKLRRLRRLGADSVEGPHRGGRVYFQFSEQDFEGLEGDPNSITELLEDGDMGSIALSKGLNASWWEWKSGSALFFWRWDVSQRTAARDGMEIFIRGQLPSKLVGGRGTRKDKIPAVGKKINKVFERGYILEGHVDSTIDYFDVAKGEDIRVVYNGTSCGLNDALFAPSFWLPTAATASRPLMYYSWMADGDMGEMFLNFPMDKKIRSRSGIDVTQLKEHMKDLNPSKRDPRERVLLRWERLFMGMKPSPYNAVRYFYWAEELARGNPKAASNPLHYSRVILNLPGMKSYDPTMPHVYKWNDMMLRVAGEIVTFIDDMRACGYSKENTWQIMRRITSVLQYLGIQDAPRKRRPPSQSPGAWAGSLNSVTPERVGISVTQEKWEKGRGIIFGLADLCVGAPEPPDLDHKGLEKDRGFLTHLSMTFPAIVPLLKGMHLTLDQWRMGRDAEGWAKTSKDHREWMRHFHHFYKGQDDLIYDIINAGAPVTVKPLQHFVDNLVCLVKIFSMDCPPTIVLRSLRVFLIIYGFGDASGKGFGSTFSRGEDISYRIGTWGEDESDESSNWREFTNVVESLEEEAEGGRLNNTAVYFFTDNSTAEAAIYKGTSKSRKLLGLVIRLKVLEVRHSIHLVVCHVAGTRMIAEGGDGVSRGLLNEGVMAGENILSFIPLHLSAIERSSSFLPWLESWTNKNLIVLTPEDWYELGHDIRGWTHPQDGDLFARPTLLKGCFVWAPPPAAADVALEQLRIARIKRQDSTHVFVVPRLLTPKWLKQLWKACDIVLSVPAGTLGWETNMFEPVLIGICFPYLSVRPWQLRGAPKMFQVARDLRRLFKEDGVDERPFLRKFWSDCHRLRSLQEDVVSRLLYFLPNGNLPHSSKRGGGDRPNRVRRRRRPDDLSLAPKEKKPRRLQSSQER